MRVTKVHLRRLRKLAGFLRTVKRKRFDMTHYAGEIETTEADHVWPPPPISLTGDCGTSACALGWATVVFPRKLGLTRDRFVRRRLPSGRLVKGSDSETFFGGEERYSLQPDETASNRVHDLFYGGGCTPRAKAREIERLCDAIEAGKLNNE